MQSLRLGIDIGGTFTDFVVYDASTQKIETFKLLSTPRDPAKAVINGLIGIFNKLAIPFALEGGKIDIIHGSTVATNTLLERKGPPIVLITTLGFRDILKIGRQNRPVLYDFSSSPPPPIVPPKYCLEVNERIDHEGNVLKPIDLEEIDDLVAQIKKQKIESVAICLLFSFLRSEHERLIGEKIRIAGLRASVSSEILPVFREYERTSTTTVNAYVSPVMDKYLSSLERKLPTIIAQKNSNTVIKLLIMQSNGGSISPDEARHESVRCILSGPAGGLIGCEYVGRTAINPTAKGNKKELKLITFDMGGTSTDVSLIDGKPSLTTESNIGGCPIGIPMLDIHTIGAGGGSIARLDAGNILRVGPDSAGADPGPACYGNGMLPTVTDANVVLGRIRPDYCLGGRLKLSFDRAFDALDQLSVALHMPVERIALGIVAIVNAHMARALRVISIERGHDPRLFDLLAFGGAGGLHASELAHNLGIKRIIIPPWASTLSALGMLAADVRRDYSQTVMLPGNTPASEISCRLEQLAERGRCDLKSGTISEYKVRIEKYIDVRYAGQSYELMVPFSTKFIDDFHKLHKKYYGYANFDGPVILVNLRIRAIGIVTPPPLGSMRMVGHDPKKAYIGLKEIIFPKRKIPTPLYQAEALQPGNQIAGPALIIRSDTSILVNPHDVVKIDSYGNAIVEVGK